MCASFNTHGAISKEEKAVPKQAPPLDEAAGRVPPHDEFAEQSVLGGMLLSPDATADVVGTLRPDNFYAPKHELIYTAIMTLYAKSEPTDVVTVSGELSKTGQLEQAGGTQYLHDLTSLVPTAANASYYAEIVAEKSLMRRLTEVGTKIAKLGYDGQGEAVDLLNQAQSEIYQISERETSTDYVSFAEALEQTIREVETLASGEHDKTIGIPTGFRELDEMTNGLHPGQLVIIAARPGVGKSTLALDFARSAAIHQKQATVFFSLEMSQMEIAKRLIAAETDTTLSDITRGTTLKPHNWNAINKFQAKSQEAPLFFDDTPNTTLLDIRSKCRRLKQREDLKLVIVDYVQLISGNKRAESRQQEVSEFSRALKLLAKELEVPIVALSQLNRASEQRADKVPALSDLRESGSLEQDADMVILVHRQDLVEKESLRAGEADFIVAKQRNGPTGVVTVSFRGSYSRFQDLPKQNDPWDNIPH